MGTPEERGHLSFSLFLVPSIGSHWLGGFLFSLRKLEKNMSGSHCCASRSSLERESPESPSLPRSLPSPFPLPPLAKQYSAKVADRPGFKPLLSV